MKKLYSSPVFTASQESSIFEVLRQMQTNFVKRIVITSKNKPIGIVTERDINQFLGEDKTARVVDEIPVKHVMQKNIVMIADGFEDHFEQCAARMTTFKIGSVILVNESGNLLGIVSRTDLVKSYANVFGGKYLVKDFMCKNVVTCRKSDSLKYALNLMNKNKISRLVVTDEDGCPVSLITTNTLLTHSDYFTKGNTRSRDYLLPFNKGEKLFVNDLLGDVLITINEEDDLSFAASLMIKNKISGIPVVNSNQNLIGMISKTNIVKAFSILKSHEEIKSSYKNMY